MTRASAGFYVSLLAGLCLFGAATGLAFAGWLDHGARIFHSMVESGLAWCF